MKSIFDRVENIVEKEENADKQHFLTAFYLITKHKYVCTNFKICDLWQSFTKQQNFDLDKIQSHCRQQIKFCSADD